MKFLSVRLNILLLAVLGGLAWPAAAQSVPHLATIQPGGLPGIPVLGTVSKLTNGIQITWDGPAGYYQVFEKTNGLGGPWIALGKATNLACAATITQLYSNAFFRVSGPAANYAGAKQCQVCHAAVCQYETNTAHASAFASPTFKALGGQTNALCLPCHTVGYGLPTGFVSAAATPLLAGVQCENCHGPAGNHVASEDDPTVRPRVEVAATLCGGCHTTSHTTYTNPPTYAEWSASAHAAIPADTLQAMASSAANIDSCGACHSGPARLALLNGQDPARTLTNDYDVPVTCVVCHDPHQTNSVSPAQLRNPLFSTNDFHLLSSDLAGVGTFTNKYNANTNISLCAQCHNDRGAAWTDTARAPHHSLQYNLLIGSVGTPALEEGPFNPGTHASLARQCADCHMAVETNFSTPNAHDHSLAVNYVVCENCHTNMNGPQIQAGPQAQAYWFSFLAPYVNQTIQNLNRWAVVQTNAFLSAGNQVAWEYTTPGGVVPLTNSTGTVTNWSLQETVTFAGPSAAGQALIPDSVKKARFDLYLFLNDGSLGAHNPYYAYSLLEDAENFSYEALAP